MDVLTLKLEAGDFDRGFASVTVQIHSSTEEGDNNSIQRELQLPPAPELRNLYQRWQEPYNNLVNPDSSRGIKKEQRTNYSFKDDLSCSYQELQQEVNRWLQGLKDELEPLICSRRNVEILFEIQTFEDIPENVRHLIEQLHWEKWNLFPEDAKVGVAFTYGNAIRSDISAQRDGEPRRNKRVRILGILGHGGEGIDLKADEELIRQLPGAEPHFLYEPELSEFQKLWDENWDILFYGGHSETVDEGRTGWLVQLNPDEDLDIQRIRQTLKTAIAKGLKLAIFSSCDGLGLARQLRDLDLPYIIVWKEPISTEIAKKFLEYFLKAFAEGMIIEKAVWQAQTQLREWSNCERDLPGVTSLIATIRNSAQSSLTWFDLGGIPICPYRGLSAFQEEHAPYFFGRDRFAKTLLEAVRKKPLVAVVGASGSGKSSVVLAGLIPLLRQDKVVQWQVAVFRPGTNPIESLAIALTSVSQIRDRDRRRLAELEAELRTTSGISSAVERIVDANPHQPYTRLVLVADQFEELYTNAPETERHTFIDGLLYAVKSTPSFTLVLTLRGDFYGSAISYPPLSHALQDAVFNLSSMNREELRDAIVCPAEKMRVQLEPGLADTLIGDLGDSAGRLPLLEFTLSKLWEQQQNYTLTHQAYQDIEGLERAIALYAESVYTKLSEYERKQARRVFIKLVQLGEGMEATRRLATREQIKEENWDLVRKLADEDARLVVTNRNESTGEETVEIIHEALIRHWGRLEQWLEQNKDFLRWLYRLEDALRQWESHENQEGYLLREAPLVEAQGWLESRREELSNPQSVFIQLSLELRERKQQREKEQKQRETRQARRIALGSLIATGLLAGLTTIAGLQLRKAEAEQIRTALALSSAYLSSNQELEAQIEIIRAGKMLQQSLWQRIFPDLNLKTQVFQEMQNTLSKVREINRIDSSQFRNIIFSHDRKKIVTFSNGSIVSLWDFEGKKLAEFKIDKELINLDQINLDQINLSPDDTKLAFVDSSKSAEKGDIIIVFNLAGDLLVKFENSRSQSRHGLEAYYEDLTEKLIFSPDGNRVATIGGEGDNKIVRLWNLEGRKLSEFKFTVLNSSSYLTSDIVKVASNYNEKKLAIKISKNIYFLDWNSEQITKFEADFFENLENMAFSPEGTKIATVEIEKNTDYRIVNLWNLKGKQLAQFKTKLFASEIVFTPEGKSLYLVDKSENYLSGWNLESKQLFEYPSTQDLDFTSDGQHIAIAINRIVGFRTSTKSPTAFDVNIVHQGLVQEIMLNYNGLQLVTQESGVLHFWNLRQKDLNMSFEKKMKFKTQINNMNNIVFDLKGTQMATSSDEGLIELWNIAGRKIAELNSQKILARKILFTPNGNQLAILGNNGSIYLWNFQSNQLIELQEKRRFEDMTFSQNGTQLVTVSSDGIVRFWDLQGKQINSFKAHHGSAWSIIFSSDGTKMATRGADNFVRIWSMEGNQLAEIKAHSDNSILSTIFSPNGKFLATSGTDNYVRLWDLKGKLLAERNLESSEEIVFSSDSTILLIRGMDFAYLWQITNNQLTKINNIIDGKFIFSNTLPLLVAINFKGNYQWDSYGVKVWDLNGNQLGQLGEMRGYSHSAFNPNSNLITTVRNNGLVEIWQFGNVETLLSRGCKKIQNYLKNNPTVAAKDRTLCDRIEY